MNYRIFIYSIISLLINNACFEEDKKVSPYPGEISTIEYNIGDYESYFDLESNTVVSYNSIQDWDLGFECGINGWHIRVNSARGLFIHKTNMSTFNEELSTNDLTNWEFDASNGNLNLTAIGIWIDTIDFLSLNKLYIIGIYEGSAITPLYKVLFTKVDSFDYNFLYQSYDNASIDTSIIYKSDSVNFVYFSFSEKKQKYLSPNKENYDLVFAPYYDSVSINNLPVIPYLVRGVLLNHNKVLATVDTINYYDEISNYDLNKYLFSSRRDLIGYNWKEVIVDFSSGTAAYNVLMNRTYIIKSTEGNYYKFRFLSYNLNGIDGFPRFEYKPIIPAI